MDEFDKQDSNDKWLEIILTLLSVISLLCACLLTNRIGRTRYIAQQQAKLALSMDISMDNLLNNSSDYALTEFVIFMSISDIFRSLIKTFRHLRSAFDVWTVCNLGSISGIICLCEDFITWSLISNDILCYGVICFCLFRYLRKRSIFTRHSITPQRIRIGIILISVIHSSIQTLLVILYYNNHFNYEIIYIPSLVILYCTIGYIVSVAAYIRCCHPFWILSKSNKSQYLFLIVFTVIFIVPITSKMILASVSWISSPHWIMLYICDVLLTQTGTGNFLAWSYSQKDHITEMKHSEKLFHNEESVELGNDIEYVIDVKQLTNNKHKNGSNSRSKKSTFGIGKLSLFSSPNHTTSHSNNAMDDNGANGTPPYEPPTISIDVMAMEPVSHISESEVSYSDNNFNLTDQLFIESSRNVFIEPENRNQHIMDQYGVNIDSENQTL